MNDNEETRSAFREGDVVRYQTLTRPNGWCREGIAIAHARHDGALLFADTYWDAGGDNHILTRDEIETAELQFNLADYRELGSGEDRESVPREFWETITSQHGHRKRRFVRVDAGPTWEQKHANARQEITDALDGVASAIFRLERARNFADYLRERESDGVKPW